MNLSSRSWKVGSIHLNSIVKHGWVCPDAEVSVIYSLYNCADHKRKQANNLAETQYDGTFILSEF